MAATAAVSPMDLGDEISRRGEAFHASRPASLTIIRGAALAEPREGDALGDVPAEEEKDRYHRQDADHRPGGDGAVVSRVALLEDRQSDLRRIHFLGAGNDQWPDERRPGLDGA